MAMGRWWQGLMVGALAAGHLVFFGEGIPPAIASDQVFAQSTEGSAQAPVFLATLWQLNQTFLAIAPQLETIPADLAAVNAGTREFDPELFQTYGAELQQLQGQVTSLESQLVTVNNPAQREALEGAIANFREELDGLATLVQPLGEGFNPETIRRIQEFLDFFEQYGLGEADYGFYGTVTQTELETYLNRQLPDLRDTLKALNETATQAAIAPDLETSIAYLYTSLSLGNAIDAQGGESFQAIVQQLQRDNRALRRRLNTTSFLFGLLLILGAGAIAFLYRRKMPQQPHPGQKYFPDAAPEPLDPEQIEAAIVQRLQHTYDLKPKENFSRPQSAAPLAVATAAPVLESSAPTPDLDLNLEGDFEMDFAEDFPVQFLNPYDELVERYNRESETLSSEAIALRLHHPVSDITGEDTASFLMGLCLETDDQGAYWAIEIQGAYYLVPRAQLQIAPEQQDEFQQIFVCYGDPIVTPQTIKLLKPARVARTDSETIWELVQPGIVLLEGQTART
jgi:hypothetical protein